MMQTLEDELQFSYKELKNKITTRLKEFKNIYDNGSELDFYSELIFCILTPQSKAKLCWEAVKRLKAKDLFFINDKIKIQNELFGVRFKYKKSEYIIEVKKHFFNNNSLNIKEKISSFSDVYECRDWFVKNIKGYGYKEASHFLRNIGLFEDIAILDRHILRNMVKFHVISQIPDSISKNKYLELEKKLLEFSHKVKIPPSHLDLLFWYNQTGEIFK